MKAVTTSLFALTLCISTAMAADGGSLSPGHPAGLKQAQISGETALLGGIGVAAAIAIGFAVSSSDNAGTAAPTSSTVVSTSTTS